MQKIRVKKTVICPPHYWLIDRSDSGVICGGKCLKCGKEQGFVNNFKEILIAQGKASQYTAPASVRTYDY